MVTHRLRALELTDIETLLAWENHTDQWEVSLRTSPFSRSVLEQYITAAAADFWEIGQVRFVLCRSQDSSALGLVDVFNASALHSKAEIGLLINSEYRGQGLGPIALKLVQDWAIRYAMLDQLYAQIFSDNLAAYKAFKKTGFGEIGRWKQWIKAPSGNKDVVLMQWIKANNEP